MVSKSIIRKSLDDAVGKCVTIKERFEGFNAKDYKSEKYSKKLGQIKSAEKSPVGALQQKQEDLQEEVDYTNEEKSILNSYSVSTFSWFDSYFNKGNGHAHGQDTIQFGKNTRWMLDVYKWEWTEYYDEEYGTMMERYGFKEPLEYKDFNIYDFEGFDAQDRSAGLYDRKIGEVDFPKAIDIVDNMIDKSPPLQENTVLYRVGVFDPNLKPGETSKFKSYTSTSFNSYVARNGIKKYAGFDPSDDCYQLKIYAPKGTKGVVPCQNTGCEDWQSEYTLGRNQKYIVLSVDNVSKTAEILLY